MDAEETKLYVAFLVGVGVLIVLISIYVSSMIRTHRIIRINDKTAAEAGLILRDKERKRIAADLHDSVGSSLVSIMLNLAAMKDRIPEHAAQIQPIILSVQNSLGAIRSIAHNLIPDILVQYGLETALRSLVFQLRKLQNMKVHFYYDLEPCDPEKAVHMYYLVQEIISNIHKHSQATCVNVSIRQQPCGIEMLIQDNGVGMDKQVLVQKINGLGLHNIFTRTNILNGRVQIDTQPRRGVKYIFTLPKERVQ